MLNKILFGVGVFVLLYQSLMGGVTLLSTVRLLAGKSTNSRAGQLRFSIETRLKRFSGLKRSGLKWLEREGKN